MAVGGVSAVTVAFAHLFFNLSGILFIWPLPSIRKIPLNLARRLARISTRSRWLPVVYVIVCFYLIPLVVILILR
jgi:sodium-dependent phosphate cotransporter